MNVLIQGLLIALSCGAQDAAPDGTLTVNGGAKVVREASVQLRVQVTNAGAGDLEMTVSADPAVPGPWKPFAEVQTFELPAGDGKKTIVLRLRDRAGKESKPLTVDVVLDRTPPVARVSAPKRVSQEAVILTSDVPDAVGMQWTENPEVWGSWEIYLQPREIHLSLGEGLKKILVRYRDEAGNISPAATVEVEVATQSPEAPALPGIRLIRIRGEAASGDRIPVVLWLTGIGLREMELKVDDADPQKREKFESEKALEIQRTGGVHHIRLKLWEDSGAEHRAELAFHEEDLRTKHEDAVHVEDAPSARLTLKVGLLPSAIRFNTTTPLGPRNLSPGPMGLARLEWGAEIDDPWFVQASLELAEGKDLRSLSGELDLGVHLLSTEFLSCPFDLDATAGFVLSKLWVTLPGFGAFDLGFGGRAGLDARLHLTDQFSLDASIDFRFVSYPWSGVVISGDRSARTLAAGILFGVSLHF